MLAQPWSLRQRGLRHNTEAHVPEFSQCPECWPGAVMCGRCGHMSVDGAHGVAAYKWHGIRGWVLYLKRSQACAARVGAQHVHMGGEACGCRTGVPPREVIVDTGWGMLPGSSGLAAPRAFRQSSASGHRRGLRGRR